MNTQKHCTDNQNAQPPYKITTQPKTLSSENGDCLVLSCSNIDDNFVDTIALRISDDPNNESNFNVFYNTKNNIHNQNPRFNTPLSINLEFFDFYEVNLALKKRSFCDHWDEIISSKWNKAGDVLSHISFHPYNQSNKLEQRINLHLDDKPAIKITNIGRDEVDIADQLMTIFVDNKHLTKDKNPTQTTSCIFLGRNESRALRLIKFCGNFGITQTTDSDYYSKNTDLRNNDSQKFQFFVYNRLPSFDIIKKECIDSLRYFGNKTKLMFIKDIFLKCKELNYTGFVIVGNWQYASQNNKPIYVGFVK